MGCSTPSMCLAKTEPMTPYWSRCRGLGKTFAPTSRMTQRPFAVGITAAMPGRWTHLRNFRMPQPAGHDRAGVAGADEAVHLLLGEQLPAADDGVVRLAAEASTGFSFMSTRDGGVDTSSRGREEPGRRRSSGFELGLIADENDREVRGSGEGKHRPGHVRGRAVVAAHRVQRDPHDFTSRCSSSIITILAALVATRSSGRRGAAGPARCTCGQYWTCTGVRWWWLRRVPCLDCDVRLLGTAMTYLATSMTGKTELRRSC